MRFGGFPLGKTTRHSSDAKLETNKGLGLTKDSRNKFPIHPELDKRVLDVAGCLRYIRKETIYITNNSLHQ